MALCEEEFLKPGIKGDLQSSTQAAITLLVVSYSNKKLLLTETLELVLSPRFTLLLIADGKKYLIAEKVK